MTIKRYPIGASGNPAPAPFPVRMRAKRALKRRDRELYEPRFELATEGLVRLERGVGQSDLGSDRLRLVLTP